MASSSAPAPPSHKLIPGCGFLVDGFQTRYAAHPSVKAYFLTHAHSDHYNGLRDDWSRGVIYCSHVTARLIAHMLGVGRRWLHPLPLDSPTMIQGGVAMGSQLDPEADAGLSSFFPHCVACLAGVEVTLVSANHCPGAVQFLFRLPDGRRFIHTGDMRFSPALLANPHLQQFRRVFRRALQQQHMLLGTSAALFCHQPAAEPPVPLPGAGAVMPSFSTQPTATRATASLPRCGLPASLLRQPWLEPST